MAKLMIVDDEAPVRELLATYVATLGHEAHLFPSGRTAIDGIDGTEADMMIVDLRIGDMDGLQVIKECKAKRPDLQVVMITGHGSVETAVAAMRLGAYDFLTKPFDLEDLGKTISAALTSASREDGVSEDEKKPIVGKSDAVRKVQLLIERIARRPANVVFEGEYGVGKIAFARQLHRAGPSAAHPFLTLHCSALPESMLEQELGGRDGSGGAFARAAGGTLVIEEVDCLRPRMQALLHDQLESGPGKPFRVIATTTRSLDGLVRKGEFRSDLFYRLSVLPVSVPPLRERTDDILPLAEYFLADLGSRVSGLPGSIEKEARKLLQKYPWPGNVGELRNAVQRACALATGREITSTDLPSRLRQSAQLVLPPAGNQAEDDSTLPIGQNLNRFIREQERRFIKATLSSVAGNKEQAAGMLGISLATLYRKLDE